MLLAGCATQQLQSFNLLRSSNSHQVIQQPPVSQQTSGVSDTPKSQINKNRDRDLSECERESAFAGAGDKRQIFDKCMKARGYY